MKKTMLYLPIITLFIFLFSNMVSAEIIVEKNTPAKVMVNIPINISIQVMNTFSQSKHISITEMKTYDVVQTNGIIPSLNIPQGIIATPPQYIVWEATLNSGETKSFYYTIEGVPVGDLLIPETSIRYDTEEIIIPSKTIIVECNNNKVCEQNFGETNVNCKIDCTIDDGSCDLSFNGICDPDCVDGADRDCVKKDITPPVKKSDKLDKSAYFTYFLIAAIIIVVAFIVLKFITGKGNKKEGDNYSDLVNRLQKK